jgi:transketolase
MRRDFVKQMLIEMEQNPNIIFLTGDLGFNALEPIKEKFPDRFVNVGIAEQHMVGMAAGLALEGKKVIVYSIASFSSLRPYEQIRTDVCYHDLDVKIIGVGGGVNYATHGITHHTIEDIAIMNVLPNMKVFAPGYSWEATEVTKALMNTPGPAYVRLGLSPGVDYSKPHFKFVQGKGYVVREGKDILLISTGNILNIVIEKAQLLEKALGKSVCVISMPSLKPLDEELILKHAKDAEGIFTIEEHSVIGGLGSLVGVLLWKHGIPKKKFHSFGFPDQFVKDVGDRNYLLGVVGIEANALAKKVVEIMKK